MAKRRATKRTHGFANVATPGTPHTKLGNRSPKSMVIRIGASNIGHSVTELVRDVRSVMEPQTASRLKERKANKLRDYTTMAGPLGVTHLLLFSRSSNGNTNLRLAVTPRGPTLHFRVEKYSLCKDVHRSMKRPKSGGSEYLTAPLLVMNHFITQSKEGANGEAKSQHQIPKDLESLTTTIFQSLFPPINPTTTPLKGIKRVLLLDRIPQNPCLDYPSYTLNLRHYAIETRTAKSVPKQLRRLDAAEKLTHAGQRRKRGALPNLGKLDDVADYILDPHAADGFTSGSESEPDTDAEVDVLAQTAQKVRRQQNKKDGEAAPDRRNPKASVQRKAIKLHELGPRLKLRLTKVEEGLCSGKVIWHEYIHKSKEELKEMDRIHEQRRLEKERRRAEQKANIERKRRERGANGQDAGGEEDDELEEEMDDDEWDDEDVDGDTAVGADNAIGEDMVQDKDDRGEDAAEAEQHAR